MPSGTTHVTDLRASEPSGAQGREEWIGAGPITHLPSFRRPQGKQAARHPVERFERLLSDWFGRPVVLLASARTGLKLLLEAKGCDRHNDRLWLPQYMSRCVFNAVTHNAQPVTQAHGRSVTLLYHQFGFHQRTLPSGFVIEDLAHSFFAGPTTGARRWRGDCAIFSLPKFFGMQGLGGGVILESAELAAELRARVAGARKADPAVRGWMRAVVREASECQPGQACPASDWLEAAYELLFRFPAPDAGDLEGMPSALDELVAIGTARAERVSIFRAMLGWSLIDGFWPSTEEICPFALPYFSPHGDEALRRVNAALERAGVFAGVFHIDVRRDMHRPSYLPCVLLPCHHQISVNEFTAMCEVVARADIARA